MTIWEWTLTCCMWECFAAPLGNSLLANELFSCNSHLLELICKIFFFKFLLFFLSFSFFFLLSLFQNLDIIFHCDLFFRKKYEFLQPLPYPTHHPHFLPMEDEASAWCHPLSFLNEITDYRNFPFHWFFLVLLTSRSQWCPARLYFKAVVLAGWIYSEMLKYTNSAVRPNK